MPLSNDELLERLARIEGRLPSEPAEEQKYDDTGRMINYVHQPWPVTVYRPLGKDEPPAPEHPGFASAIANNQGELDEAKAAGWTTVYAPTPAPVKGKFSAPGGKFGKPAESAKK